MKGLILYIAFALLTTSCATVFTGTKDTIRFESDPSGATVYIDGVEICKTPCSEAIRRDISLKHFEMKLDGYKTRVINLDQKFNVVSMANLLNVLGFPVDVLTGSLIKYGKKFYNVELERKVSMNEPNKIDINTTNKTVDIYVGQK